MITSAPFGSWTSPLSLDDLAGATLRLETVRVDGEYVYWKQTDPDGVGRLFRARRGEIEELPSTTAAGQPADVASALHEYGGPDFAVERGVVVFSQRGDARLYLTQCDRESGTWSLPAAISPDDGVRYADLSLSFPWVFAVAERHDGPCAQDVVNFLVRVNVETGVREELAVGADFYGNPRLRPDGAALAWYEWNHPAMPWDATTLKCAPLTAAGLGEARQIAGGDNVSAISPCWTGGGDLLYVSDDSGWWNVYRAEDPEGECRIRALHPVAAEFAPPPWVLESSLTILDEDHALVRWTRDGRWSLGTLKIANGELEEWLTGLDPVGEVASGEGRVAFVGEAPAAAPALVELDLANATVRTLRTSAPSLLPGDFVSHAESLDWKVEGGVAHGFFYPPTNPDFAAPDGELPPVLVLVHGGPTAATSAGFSPLVQFWTTRGIAVLDVNYRGSTGWGRSYREELRGRWGVADIEDIAAGVAHLAAIGAIDGSRAAIRGGSAGGYAVLRALTATDAFSAGTSRYGIGDLAALAADTHKFESRYIDGLIGPFAEVPHVYRERSPIHHLSQLSAPVLLLQGTEDKVVPPSQATDMARAIEESGGTVEVVFYQGEGHGFRKAENVKDAVSRELAFYGRVFGFTPAPEGSEQ